MSKCKSCGAEIDWVQTEKGKKMPVNPEEVSVFPDKNGSTIGITAYGTVVKGILAMKGSPGSAIIRVSHFSSCSGANTFRRK
jgi:hypothetical protein